MDLIAYFKCNKNQNFEECFPIHILLIRNMTSQQNLPHIIILFFKNDKKELKKEIKGGILKRSIQIIQLQHGPSMTAQKTILRKPSGREALRKPICRSPSLSIS
jgi:hypothetical protein